MRIDKNIQNPATLIDTSLTALKSGTSSETAAASTPQADAFQPTPDFQGLVVALRQIPDSRQALLQDVASRLASGFYLTPQAADLAAKAIAEI